MRCLPAVILAVLLVATEGKVVPASDVESQQTGTQPFQLSDYIKEAKAQIDNLNAQLQQHLPNQEEFVNTMKEQSNNFVSNIQEYMKNVTDEIKAKSPELENVWANMKSKLSETIDNLNINPETAEQVNQLRNKFQEGFQTVLTQSENVAKTFNENSSKVQEDVAKLFKQGIDIAVEASQNLKDRLQQVTPVPQPQN